VQWQFMYLPRKYILFLMAYLAVGGVCLILVAGDFYPLQHSVPAVR
jgi:hypothetical protein